MRDQCSPAVARAIDTAPAPATVAGLLRALTEDEDGRAAVLLEKHGTRREILRSKLMAAATAAVSIDELIAAARGLSRERQTESAITSEFFLLALLADGQLHEIVVAAGLDRAGLEREILGESTTGEFAAPALAIEAPGEHHSERAVVWRVLDVNANRVRESLRTLDDYCRFDLNDAVLTGEIKQLRHELGTLFDLLPGGYMLACRDTQQDVGTTLDAEGEMFRASPADVARINARRLQESLRSIEEFGKVVDRGFAEEIEQLRYRTYTIEKALLQANEARQKLHGVRLYVLLTGSQCEAALDWTIAEAAAGGAGMFQLREKDLDDRALLRRAVDVRQWTRRCGALFIINDRPDIARLVGADGVHLGQNDLSVQEARRIVGPDALIGVSTHDVGQVRRAVLDGASYIGVGPTLPSSTKNFEVLAGIDLIKLAMAETSLPAFAIGGIDARNIDSVVAAGARRVAVSAAIARSNDPRLTAQLLIDACRLK